MTAEERIARMRERVEYVRRAALVGRTLVGMDAPYENDVPYLLGLLDEKDVTIQRLVDLVDDAAAGATAATNAHLRAALDEQEGR